MRYNLKNVQKGWVSESKILPFDEFKKLANVSVEHLFGCQEWCDYSWCYAVEIDQARQTYTTAAVTASAIATVTGGAQFPIHALNEVINPAECVLCPECATTTITDGAEVPIHTPTKVLSPPKYVASPESSEEICLSKLINFMSNNSSKFTEDSEMSSDSEEEIKLTRGGMSKKMLALTSFTVQYQTQLTN